MATETRPTICRFCFNGCGILVDFEDGRPVRVRGDRENPIYQGYICVKGQQLVAQHQHPDRLLHPMKRGADGVHRRIPLEQAYDEIAERIGEIRDRYGPRAVATYSGTYSTSSVPTPALLTAWIKALGSPMAFTANTIDQPGKAVAQALHGAWMAPYQDFASSDVALLVGCNPLVAMSGGIPMGNPGRFLTDALARGLQLVAIDPRRTETARRATLHLQPRPGEDAAILASMLHVILLEGLHDAEFCAENVNGLETLRAALAPFEPALAAARAGLRTEEIVQAARMFGGARRGVATAGTGPNMAGRGTLLEYLLLCLNSVCGRWLRAGEPVHNPGTLLPTFSAVAQAAPPRPAYGFGEKLRVRDLANTAAGMPTAGLADEILLEGDGKVRALLSIGGNPVAAWPDQLKALEAMDELELLVQTDIKMSATARRADYVLPAKLSLEMPGMTQSQDSLALYSVGLGWPVAYGQYTPAHVEPPEGSEVIEDWELFYETARRLGLELRIKSIDLNGGSRGQRVPLDMEKKPSSDDLIEMLAAGSRIPLSEVKKHPGGATFPEPALRVAPREPGWEGRLEVAAEPMMEELSELAAEDVPGDPAQGEYPFRLISRRMMHAYNSSGRDLPGLQKRWRYNPAFMNPLDLQRLALAPGDGVEIRSDRAVILGVVEPDPSVREGVVSMSHAYGDSPEYDGELREIGSNTGRLTFVDRDFDRYTGLPRMSNIPVQITPRDI